MPGKGRKRTPTKIKKIRGTLRHDRQVENELQPDTLKEVPLPPEMLNEDGKSLWFNICTQCFNLGILSIVGIPQITQYCVHWQIWNYNARKVTKSRTPGVKNTTKVNRIDTNYRAMMEAQKWMERFESNWGLNPASAAKISVPDQQEGPKSKFDI